jgi:hypothetical protein
VSANDFHAREDTSSGAAGERPRCLALDRELGYKRQMRGSKAGLVVGLVVAGIACGGKAPTPPSRAVANEAPPDDTTIAPARFHVAVVAAPGTTAIEGTIRDAATADPLPGVTIVVSSPALGGELAAITDELGRFSLSTVPPGTYRVTAFYSDLTAEGTATVGSGQVARLTLDWDLSASASAGEGTTVAEDAARPEPAFKTAREALARGALGQAVKLGQAELDRRPTAQLHGTLAIARYGLAIQGLRFGAFASQSSNPIQDLRNALATFLGELDDIQDHLVAASADPAFALELCVACMAAEDGHLMAVPPGALDVERDRSGRRLPEDDPRRRPTYRFDHGDLAWGRAMVHFQQAFANLALAYDWTWLERRMADSNPDDQDTKAITIKLAEPARIDRAHELLLAALAASDEARVAYLAETDDDREWVPNPKQRDYASPLPVDAQLYQTWEQIVGDVRRLLRSETGLALPALWTLLDVKQRAPVGFVDLGAMLTQPSDIVVDVEALERIGNEKNATRRANLTTAFIKGLVGNGYNAKMKASPITDRLLRLRKDLDRADDVFEDKLKYLLWLN